MDCRLAFLCLVTFVCLNAVMAKPVSSRFLDAPSIKSSASKSSDTASTNALITVAGYITDEPLETAAETRTSDPAQTGDHDDDDWNGTGDPSSSSAAISQDDAPLTSTKTPSEKLANRKEEDETDEIIEDETDNQDVTEAGADDETTRDDTDEKITGDDADGETGEDDTDDGAAVDESETGEINEKDDNVPRNSNVVGKLEIHETDVDLDETNLQLSLGVELDAIVTKGCNKFKPSSQSDIATWLLNELKQYYPTYSWNLFVEKKTPASLQYNMCDGRYKAWCNENEYEIWFNVGDADLDDSK